MNVAGTIDEEPVEVSIHYIDGQQVTILASYREEGFFQLAFTTTFRDISIGIRKVCNQGFGFFSCLRINT